MYPPRLYPGSGSFKMGAVVDSCFSCPNAVLASSVCEQCRHRTIAWDEPAVKVRELLHRFRLRPHTADSLFSSMPTPHGPMLRPRNDSSILWNSHFSTFVCSPSGIRDKRDTEYRIRGIWIRRPRLLMSSFYNL